MQHTFKVGDKVRVRRFNSVGVVIGVCDDWIFIKKDSIIQPKAYSPDDLIFIPPPPTVVYTGYIRAGQNVAGGKIIASSPFDFACHDGTDSFEQHWGRAWFEQVKIQRLSDGTWKIEKVA